MTSSQNSNDQEQLTFLLHAAYTMASTCPALSRQLMSTFSQISIEQEIPLSSSVQRQYCCCCGSLYLPLQTQVRIVRNRKRKNKSSQETREHGSTVGLNESLSFSSVRLDPDRDDNEEELSVRNKIRTMVDRRIGKDDASGVIMSRKAHVSYLCLACKSETKLSLPEPPKAIKPYRDVKTTPIITSQTKTTINVPAISKQSSHGMAHPVGSANKGKSTLHNSGNQNGKSKMTTPPIHALSAPSSSITGNASKKKKKKGKQDLKSLIQTQKKRDSGSQSSGYQLSDFLNEIGN